jgi:hypothetical protein
MRPPPGPVTIPKMPIVVQFGQPLVPPSGRYAKDGVGVLAGGGGGAGVNVAVGGTGRRVLVGGGGIGVSVGGTGVKVAVASGVLVLVDVGVKVGVSVSTGVGVNVGRLVRVGRGVDVGCARPIIGSAGTVHASDDRITKHMSIPIRRADFISTKCLRERSKFQRLRFVQHYNTVV